MGQPIAAIPYGDCAVVLMRDGSVFMAGFEGPPTCPWPQKPWTLRGNLFSIAGRAPGSLAGMTLNAQVLAANGDWFQLAADYNYCSGTPTVDFQGNVFAITGVAAEPGEEFAVFGGEGPGLEYAVTTLGNVFRWAPCSGWVYVGALPIGPTVSRAGSWGQLKIRHR
jgi:hypothetical protein